MSDNVQNQEREEFVSSQERRRSRLIKVGAFFLLGLFVFGLAIFVIGDRRNLFTNTFNISAYFQTVEGLRSGAPVVLSGMRIGSVTSVMLVSTDTAALVRVDMVIDEEFQPNITTSSVAAIGQEGIIGDKQVQVFTTDPRDPPIAEGGVLETAPPANYLAILEKADRAVQNVNNITSSLDTLFLRFRRGEGTLGKLLTDDEAYNSLVNVSTSAERLFSQTGAQFEALSGTLNRAAGNVDAITAESQRLVADLNKGKGTIGALLYDRSLYDSLETLVGTLNGTADAASYAAREFGVNMQGLRSSWLGSLVFGGGEEAEQSAQLLARELEIQREELRRKEALLEEREQRMIMGSP